MNHNYHIDRNGWILLSLLFVCLAVSGYISYRAIEWDVLEKLEATPLVLPTQIPSLAPIKN